MARCASVASAFGEMPYVIEEGASGYLSHSTDEWAEKLKKLLSDAELREKLGRAGQKTVREQYSYGVMIPSMIELINSLSESTIR